MAEKASKSVHSQGRGWILMALMFTIMLAAMDTTIVSTAIPHIVGDLGGFSQFSWVYSIYLLAQTVTIPLYGKLADLYGRKPILLFGMLIFIIGSVASAASWNMMALIVFRGVQGLGAGSIMATVNTLAGDLYSVEERAKVQGWLSSVWGIAAIMGPSLGGAFAEYVTWRWIFLINLPIGVIAMVMIIVFLKEKIVQQKHHIDYPGAAMMLISGVSLIFTLMQLGQGWSLFSLRTMGMLLLSVFLIYSTIRMQKKSPEPIMPNWIWRNKVLVGSNLAMICMGSIMLGPSMFLPVFSQSVLGLGAIAAGFVLGSMSIGWPLASSLSGKLYLRIGFKNTAQIGTAIIILAIAGFLLIPYKASVWWLVADQVFLGAGFGLLSTPTLVGVQSIVPWRQRGMVTGGNMFSRYMGQSIGAAVLGGVFNRTMANKLLEAPSNLKAQLPQEVNEVIEVLQAGNMQDTVKNYLQYAFYESSHHVYITMGTIALVLMLVLSILPKKFPLVNEDETGR